MLLLHIMGGIFMLKTLMPGRCTYRKPCTEYLV